MKVYIYESEMEAYNIFCENGGHQSSPSQQSAVHNVHSKIQVHKVA